MQSSKPVIYNWNGQFYVNNSRILLRYVRNRNFQKRGIVVSLIVDDTVRFGYSKFARNKETLPFNLSEGMRIAVERAYKRNDIQPPFTQLRNGEHLPFGIQQELQALYNRSVKYFKQIKHD